MAKFSNDLEQTLHRSLQLANDQHLRYSTLEHLLLALTENPEATEVLSHCGCDIHILRAELGAYLRTELDNKRWKEGEKWEKGDKSESESAWGTQDSVPTAEFQRVIQRAVIHVQSLGEEVVTGARVIVAIFAEKESPAARFLASQDMTRYDAVNYISHGISKKPEHIVHLEQMIEESAHAAPTFGLHPVRLTPA